MTTLPRIPWTHTWPEDPGPDFHYRDGHDWTRIMLTNHNSLADKWQWMVVIDATPKALGASGMAMTKQEAADCATEAWWRLRGERDGG